MGLNLLLSVPVLFLLQGMVRDINCRFLTLRQSAFSARLPTCEVLGGRRSARAG